MARTNSEKIDEIIKEVATLNERLNHAREEIKRLDLVPIRDRLSRLEIRLEQLEGLQSRSRERSWSIILLILSAIVGSLSTLAVQWISGTLAQPH